MQKMLWLVQIDFYTMQEAIASKSKLSQLGIYFKPDIEPEDWSGDYEDTDPAVHLYGFWYEYGSSNDSGNCPELEERITKFLNTEVLVYVEECRNQPDYEIPDIYNSDWFAENTIGLNCASIYKRPSELYGNLEQIQHFLLIAKSNPDFSVEDYLEVFEVGSNEELEKLYDLHSENSD